MSQSGFELPRVTYPATLPEDSRSMLVFPALVEAVILAGPGVRLPKVRKLEMRYGLPLQRARRLFRRLQSRGLAVLDMSDRNRPVYVTCVPPNAGALLEEASAERIRGLEIAGIHLDPDLALELLGGLSDVREGRVVTTEEVAADLAARRAAEAGEGPRDPAFPDLCPKTP